MIRMNPGEAEARQIALAVAQQAATEFGSEFSGAFLLGSLAHGGFALKSSDIDIALVLHQLDAETGARVRQLTSAAIASFNSPLTARVSVFWADPAHLRTGNEAHTRLEAVDRADLMRFGVLMWGEDLRSLGELPSAAELVRAGAEFGAAKFALEYLAQSAAELVRAGPRAASKYVLFPVRLSFTLATGEIGLNEAAVSWYLHSSGAAQELVAAAFAWRTDGFSSTEAATKLIAEQSAALYLDYFHAYRQSADVPEALREEFQRRATSIESAKLT